MQGRRGAVRALGGGAAADVSFRVLSDVARLLVSESDLARLLDSIADAVATLIPYDSLILLQADLPLRQLRPMLVRDEDADQVYRYGTMAFGDGVTGWVAERAEPVLANDVHLDPRAVTVPGTADREESMFSVPLVARDELKGVLNLYRHGPGNWFTDGEFELAQRFAELAALALDNAEIRERLEAEIVTDNLTGVYNHRYFQERLADEMRRSTGSGRPMSLLMVDIDDFKRVNEAGGHVSGDHVLAGLGSLIRAQCRQGDVACRVGGEEFGIIMPGTDVTDALRLAESLRARIEATPFNGDGEMLTVSMGVAEGPQHATGPHELVACANLALLQAKAAGKNRVSAYVEGEWSGVRAVPQHEFRTIGHLKLLQSLGSRLNRLLDVRQIGAAITQEVRELIDYHNCRVHIIDADGYTLRPVAFHGQLSEYQGENEQVLTISVGYGITGRVARTGEAVYAANAEACEFAEHIPGTPDIDESILCVPMKFDERVLGTITLSKLGLNQFDADDLRLLEVAASTGAVAFENARLFEEERQSAETANAMLRVSQALTRTRDPRQVLEEVVESLSQLLGGIRAQAWLRDARGAFRCMADIGYTEPDRARLRRTVFPGDVASRFLLSLEEPFFMPAATADEIPERLRYWGGEEGRPAIVAPVRWEPDGVGALVAVGPPEWRVQPRHFRLARGVADLASLALGNANRFADLEKAFVETVEVLANALEAKDAYTHGHARQVAELSLAVGRKIGLPEEELRVLELAGIFHDIGKIGVRSEVINKPGPLTEEEMLEMQRHPGLGSEILEPVEFLQPVRPIVAACHERWDGTGYPEGLAKEEIPLGARIIFVCDAYHAMTSDRSYRKALPRGEAIGRLAAAAGTQFDPAVVEAFLALAEEGVLPDRPASSEHED